MFERFSLIAFTAGVLLAACHDHDHDHDDHDADAIAATALDQAACGQRDAATRTVVAAASADAAAAAPLQRDGLPHLVTLSGGQGFVALTLDEPHYDWVIYVADATLAAVTRDGTPLSAVPTTNPACAERIPARVGFHAHTPGNVVLQLSGAGPAWVWFSRVGTNHSGGDAGTAHAHDGAVHAHDGDSQHGG